jgi:predicted permease
MPPEFFGVNPELAPDLWIPMLEAPGLTPWGVQPPRGESMFTGTHWWWLMIMGRLKPGISEEQARVELNLLFQRSITAGMNPLPQPENLPHLELVPARQGLNFLRQRFSQPLKILMTAVALVLLIACANVATLLLARAAGRQKEMAVRLAVGASRGRLLRQLMSESFLLAAAGGVLGMLVAQWGSRALLVLMTQEGQTISLDLRPNLTVLAFSASACLLTGILFGLAPALRATRVDLASGLKESAGTTTFRHGFGKALVAGQVAFSLLLLIGAGLFIRTLRNLENQDLGFNSRNLVLFALDPRRSGYTDDRLLALYDQVLERLRSQPGVRSATMSQNALLSGWVNNGPISTDRQKSNTGESAQVYWNGVGPDFLKTMGIPLILGRDIEPRDLHGGRKIAVVNEAMARHFFEGENPIRRHFNFGTTRNPEADYEIVGVVKSAKYDSLRNDPPRTIYLPYSRSASLGRMYFEVRSAGDPASVTPAIREAVRGVDAGLPLMDLKTQSDQMEEALSEERMFATLCSFFGALALLLVTIGLYGTLAYLVTRRTNEIGIRIALGAGRAKVVWMVLRESVFIVLFGTMAGLPIAFATTRLVASQLYGVKPNDVGTIAATLAILVAIGAMAGLIPARRASRVDPMVALRYE